jgi:hypothetical protein
MISRDDLENFIDRMAAEGVQAKEVEPGLWLLTPGEAGPEVVVHYNPPVVPLPAAATRSDFYRRLLELNASDLVHGSYGVDGQEVVLSDALELENLNFNEFQASFDSITMALASHLPTFAPFRTA